MKNTDQNISMVRAQRWNFIKKWVGGSVLFSIVFAVLAVAGCFEPAKVSIGYLAANHTDQSIVSIIVNGEGGILNATPHGSGTEICCITLPKRWRPGLTATIKWELDGGWLKDENGNLVLEGGNPVYSPLPYKTRTVEIPEYTEDELDHFDIHFFPDDEVKVLVSFVYPHHPDYKIKDAM